MSMYIALTQLTLKLQFIVMSSIFPARGIHGLSLCLLDHSITVDNLTPQGSTSYLQLCIVPSQTSPELQKLESQHLQSALSVSCQSPPGSPEFTHLPLAVIPINAQLITFHNQAIPELKSLDFFILKGLSRKLFRFWYQKK